MDASSSLAHAGTGMIVAANDQFISLSCSEASTRGDDRGHDERSAICRIFASSEAAKHHSSDTLSADGRLIVTAKTHRCSISIECPTLTSPIAAKRPRPTRH